MTGSTRITAAFASIAALAGALLSTTAALASSVPPERLARTTTVPTQRPASPGQTHVQDFLNAYRIETDGSGAGLELNVAREADPF